jgi:flagellar basal-body rod modification protein FlgD
MSTVGSAGGSPSSPASSSTTGTSALTKITPDDFLQMLITQLKNQDPTNPTSSDQILQQVSEIDNIEATTNLSTALNSVATDQGFQAATALIGQQVQGVDASGNPVSGTVDGASFSNGAASLSVGGQTMPLSGIRSIGASTTTTPSGTNAS